MNYQEQNPLDEYTLAAFLAGTLSEEQHREVIAYLAENEDARELVCMAQDAMEAARQPVTEPFALPAAPPKPATLPPSPRAPERPTLSLVRWQRYAVAAMVLLAITIGLRIGLSGNIDTLRGSEDAPGITGQVDATTLEMSWNAPPDAYSYHLVVWDVEAAESVAQHDLRATHLDDDDPFVQELHDQLVSGRQYEIRIDALNVENRVIQRSDLLQFTYHP